MKRNDGLNPNVDPSCSRIRSIAQLFRKDGEEFGLSGSERHAIVVDDVSHAALFPRVAVDCASRRRRHDDYSRAIGKNLK
jgi:hypothetical protein